MPEADVKPVEKLTAEIQDVKFIGGGIGKHDKLKNRDLPDQHPIKAITGLQAALESKQPKGNYLKSEDVPDWSKQPTKPEYTAQEVGARPDTWTPTAEEVGAMSADTAIPKALKDLTDDATHRTVTDAQKAGWDAKSNFSGNYDDLTNKPEIPAAPGDVGAEPAGTTANHNVATNSHNDIRLLISGLTDRLNAFFDSDDQTLDQLTEIIAYIQANRSLIESVTTSKVNITDIINNLTTNVTNKPLSAAQGVELKRLIDAITVPTALSQLTDESTHRVVSDAEKAEWSGKQDAGNYLDKDATSEQELHGNLRGRYGTFTWLMTTAATKNNNLTKIAVIDPSGWIYYMDKAQLIQQVVDAINGDTEAYVFSQINSQVQAYLNASQSYVAGDFSTTVITDYSDGHTTTFDDPVGYVAEIPADGTLLVQNENTGHVWSKPITAGTHTIYNAMTEDVSKLLVNGNPLKRIKPTGALRMLQVPDTWNFRDLGGWACDGGHILYNKIIRGGRLMPPYGSTIINPEAQFVLKDEIGIRQEIDMRTDEQAENRTESMVDPSVDYNRYPITAGYNSMVNVGSGDYPLTIECITKIMNSVIQNRPVYIHCSSGCDRTGTMCLLLELILGVDPTDCDRDYELSSFSAEFDMTNTTRTVSYWVNTYKRLNTYDGDTLRDKVFSWMIEGGISVNTINAFRHAMSSGTPEDLVPPSPIYNYSVTLPYDKAITLSNTETTVTGGSTYTNTLTLNDSAYTQMVVKVTMGNVDITSTAYSNGNINIPDVSGDIVITAWAYVTGKRISTSRNTLTNASGKAVTGYLNLIALKNKTIKLSGWNFAGCEAGLYINRADGGTFYLPAEGASSTEMTLALSVSSGNLTISVPGTLPPGRDSIRLTGLVSAENAGNLWVEVQS